MGEELCGAVGLGEWELGGALHHGMGCRLGLGRATGPQGAPKDPRSFRLALETGKRERAEQGEAHDSRSAHRLAGGKNSTRGWLWSATAGSPSQSASQTASQTTSPSLLKPP